MAAAAAAAVKRRHEVEAAIAEGNIPALGGRIESFVQTEAHPQPRNVFKQIRTFLSDHRSLNPGTCAVMAYARLGLGPAASG